MVAMMTTGIGSSVGLGVGISVGVGEGVTVGVEVDVVVGIGGPSQLRSRRQTVHNLYTLPHKDLL